MQMLLCRNFFPTLRSLLKQTLTLKLIGNPTSRPDRPANSTAFDEGEYLEQREQFIAMLRGIQPGKPFDPMARIRANAIMDRETSQLKLAVEKARNTAHPLALPNWIELGPNPIPNGQTQTVTSPVSGRVSAIEINPGNPNIVYVGAAQGGVYRSLDGGATWSDFDSAQSLAIGALTLDSANGRLWVGTGEANGSADSFAGVGLYRIDNVNTTADLVGPIDPVRDYLDRGMIRKSTVFNGRSISKILIVPGDPSTLLVGNSGAAIGIGGNPLRGAQFRPLEFEVYTN